MNTLIALYFADPELPQLIMTRFRTPLLNQELCCARGKYGDPAFATGTFQWTGAVRALCVLLLKTAAYKQSPSKVPLAASIAGGKGSAACSLDYALTKQPSWLCEMFGTDSQGNALLRRVINRTNSEQKYPGPTILSINLSRLESCIISVFLDSAPLGDSVQLRGIADTIESSFTNQHWYKPIDESPLVFPAAAVA